LLIAPKPTDKVPLLVSYHYIKDWPEERIKYVLENPHLEVLIDSGAFSALNAGVEVDIEEYMAWVKRWENHLFGYMLLDKLGDPKTSAENYEVMLRNGLHPIPIHVRGDGEQRMDELFERSAYVACGGFRRPKVGWSSEGYVELKMQWAKGRPVHWLGYTKHTMLMRYAPYSCDSSNVMSAAQYGLLIYPKSGGLTQIKYNELKASPPIALKRTLDRLGIQWEDLKDRRSWRCNRPAGQEYCEHLSHFMTCFAYVDYARRMNAYNGTRVFIATTGVYDTPEMVSFFANETCLTERAPYPVSIATRPRPVAEWSNQDAAATA